MKAIFLISGLLISAHASAVVVSIPNPNHIIDPPRISAKLAIVTPNTGPIQNPSPAPTEQPFPGQAGAHSAAATWEDTPARMSVTSEQYQYDSAGVIVGVLNSPADPNAEEATIQEINENFRRENGYVLQPTLTGLSSEEQAYMEGDFQSLIQNASSGMVIAVLDRINGQYVLQVQTPTQSYSCLASPGKPGPGGAVATPRFQNKTPYGAQNGIHIVSKAKSYAGARMPYPVWISGGFAIHGGDGGGPPVTGQRASHGCVRVACAKRFNADVRAVGVVNTRITIRTN